MRTRQRPRRQVDKPFEPVGRVASQPVVHRLTSDLITAGNIGHRRPVEDFENSFQTLFHSIELHQHDGPPSGTGKRGRSPSKKEKPAQTRTPPSNRNRTTCKPGTGPDPKVSTRNRNHTVKHEPGQHSSPRVAPRRSRVNCGSASQVTPLVTCGNVFKTPWRWGESNPHAPICVVAGQMVFGLVRACFRSFPSMPFKSPGSRRTASNACHRVKPVSSKRA